MCAMFIATSYATESGTMIFGKNANREPNEAHSIIRIPAKEHKARQTHTSLIPVPQVSHTYEMILSKSFQVWGAEMGVNEHGLVIGYSPVYTRVRFNKKERGLNGADLVRLGLERSRSASEALEVITQMVETYGQNAPSAYQWKGVYHHNSFMIADSNQAYLLETAGHHWAVNGIHGFQAVSGHLTIEEKYDYISDQAEDIARKNKWIKKNESFNFRKAFSKSIHPFTIKSIELQKKIMRLGKENERYLDLEKSLSILKWLSIDRDRFQAARHGQNGISMYASSFGSERHTTGSMLVELKPQQKPIVWLTGTSNPDISLFKPFYFEGQILMEGEWSVPGGDYDGTLWWEHERLARQVIVNYPEATETFIEDVQVAQDEIIALHRELYPGSSSRKLDMECGKNTERHMMLIQEWEARVSQIELKPLGFFPLHQAYWWNQNRKLDLPINIKNRSAVPEEEHEMDQMQ